MKILLVAINASYMHTSLAVRSIYNYIINHNDFAKFDFTIDFIEFTINQPIMQIIREISSFNADLVLFSSYIWNAQILENILLDIKKILPNSIIGVGGPEFSYAPQKYFQKIPTISFILFGEGEECVLEIIQKFYKTEFNNQNGEQIYSILKKIKGIYFFNENKQLLFTGKRELIENLDSLSFSYPELKTSDFDADNKIYYYESSRGCPYNCSYCLSSVENSVRFKSLQKVFEEIQFFLDAKVKLVKFVDRTYNLKSERYLKIWEYILKNHNQKTMFHFEIEAEFLSHESLEFLQTVPKGIMQFEIGVQSANKKTLQKINRSTNIEKLAENIKQIPSTIHKHLDLIAGLPEEDLSSFGKSFDFVMSLKPNALQLGFLKVLPGTQMETFAKQNGWSWQENSVYEIFSSSCMNFTEISFLKNIEVLVDEFINKNIFCKTFDFIFRTKSPWSFFVEFCNFAQKNHTFDSQRKDLYYFNLLYDFFNITYKNDDFLLLYNLLKYDFVCTGKKGNFPFWYKHIYDKEKHRSLLEKNKMLHSSRLAYSLTEFETFDFNVLCSNPENEKKITEILIKYEK